MHIEFGLGAAEDYVAHDPPASIAVGRPPQLAWHGAILHRRAAPGERLSWPGASLQRSPPNSDGGMRDGNDRDRDRLKSDDAQRSEKLMVLRATRQYVGIMY